MDKAFGWIGEIFETLLKLLPWLVIVPVTHCGVAFVRGYRVKEWKPGLHWYWPVTTVYKLMVTVRQTQRIQSKILMTKALRTVTVGALVTYVVDDVVAAVAHIAPSDIMERSQGAILAAVSSRTDRCAFNTDLTHTVGCALNGYGVKVLQAQMTEFAPCRAIAIDGHTAIGQYALWTGF